MKPSPSMTRRRRPQPMASPGAAQRRRRRSAPGRGRGVRGDGAGDDRDAVAAGALPVRRRRPRARQLLDEAEASDGGKHLRPRLVAAAYFGFGGGDRGLLGDVAGAQQLLHLGLCMHDDLIDGDRMRHGRANLIARYRAGDRAAGVADAAAERQAIAAGLLAGDLALNAALLALLMAPAPLPVRHRLAVEAGAALERTIAGELLDVRSELLRPDLAVPLRVAELKTAVYSVSLPLRLGAIAAGVDPATCSGASTRPASRSASRTSWWMTTSACSARRRSPEVGPVRRAAGQAHRAHPPGPPASRQCRPRRPRRRARHGDGHRPRRRPRPRHRDGAPALATRSRRHDGLVARGIRLADDCRPHSPPTWRPSPARCEAEPDDRNTLEERRDHSRHRNVRERGRHRLAPRPGRRVARGCPRIRRHRRRRRPARARDRARTADGLRHRRPRLRRVPLPGFADLVVGGHDIARPSP